MAAMRLAPSQARKSVKEFGRRLNLPERLIEDVLLCVSEAVTNVVMHAYAAEDERGQVHLEAAVRDRTLVVSVQDAGGGFRPHLDTPGLGLGIPIITTLAQSSEIKTSADGGTEIVMRFWLGWY